MISRKDIEKMLPVVEKSREDKMRDKRKGYKEGSPADMADKLGKLADRLEEGKRAIRMKSGEEHVAEIRYPKGHEKNPMTDDEIERKFRGNVAYGGWSDAQADAFLKYAGSVFNGKVDLTPFRR